MRFSRCFAHFVAVVVLTFANGELVKPLNCSHGQLFCRESRQCVKRSHVCSGLINCISSITSIELICSGRQENKLRAVRSICPQKWIEPTNRFCYFFQPDLKKSWFDAQQKCRALHSSGQVMSATALASTVPQTVQRRLTGFIWSANSKRNQTIWLSVSHNNFGTRRNSRCPALFIRRRNSLFSQFIFVRRNCNSKFIFICQLSSPEVKLTQSGNRNSWVSGGEMRRQSFEQRKNRLTFDLDKEKNSHFMKRSSNVKGGLAFLSNNLQDSSLVQIFRGGHSILSRNSFLSDKSTTLDVRKIGFGNKEDARIGTFSSNPMLKVKPTRKPEKFKEMKRPKSLEVSFKRNRSNEPEISKKGNHGTVVNVKPHPPLVLPMVGWTTTWPRDRFKSTELMDDSLGTKKNFRNSLPITNSISNSSSIYTWVFVSKSMTATQVGSTRQSVLTRRHFMSSLTSSFVIKPTRSHVAAVSITIHASVFAETSTKSPGMTTTETPTGFFQSKTTIIGISVGGGGLLVLTFGIVFLCCCMKRRRKRINAELAFRTSVLWNDSNWDVRFSTGVTSLSSSHGGPLDWTATSPDSAELSPNSTTAITNFLY